MSSSNFDSYDKKLEEKKSKSLNKNSIQMKTRNTEKELILEEYNSNPTMNRIKK